MDARMPSARLQAAVRSTRILSLPVLQRISEKKEHAPLLTRDGTGLRIV